MSKFRFLIRISLRFFAALMGLGLLGYLVFRTGPGVVWKQLQAVGWGLALIIILGGFSWFIKTCAWRQASSPLLAAAKNALAMKNPDVSWAYRNALWTMGTKDVDETIEASAAYTPAPVADRIRQDVLILAGTEDHFIPFHHTADFEKVLINASSVATRIFDRPSGGAGHCQMGNLTLVHAVVLDWLLEKLPASARG